jgi:hypothetical protein
MKWSSVLGTIVVAACGAGSAAAHHSAAMFDGQRSQSLHGTVKTFQFSNPHSWIQLIVDTDGKSVEWSIEMGSPQGLYRSGWRPSTLRTGQQINVVIHPERNGAPIGLFVSATRADGSPLVKVAP